MSEPRGYDVRAVVPSQTMPLWSDTVHRRRLPGDGVFDQQGFIDVVWATGFRGAWEIDILSEAERKLPLDALARRALERTLSYFGERLFTDYLLAIVDG